MTRTLPFDVSELRGRVERVEAALVREGLDAALFTGPENLYYLTGNPVSGPMALLLRPGDPPMLLADEYDEYNIRTLSWVTETRYHEVGRSYLDLIGGEVARSLSRVRVLGFDAKSSALSVSGYQRLRSLLPDSITLRPTLTVEELRLIKSPAEIECIRRAARIATMAMQAGLETVRPGRTENDVAAEVYRTAIQNGSEHVASQPYVKAGRRASITHGRWEGATIQPGDLVMLELGACVKRYHAAVMRSAVCAPVSLRVRKVAEAVVASLERTLGVLRPGIPAAAVDAAYREVIERAGFGRFNRHALGYSIGIAFAPGWGEPEIFMLSPTERRPIQAGMTFHLVPSVTIPEEVGHVACSATVLVHETGPEILTTLLRQLWEVDG